MAQDINLRRLVIKSFHIDTVEWGDHNDVTADGKMTVSRELLDELIGVRIVCPSVRLDAVILEVLEYRSSKLAALCDNLRT